MIGTKLWLSQINNPEHTSNSNTYNTIYNNKINKCNRFIWLTIIIHYSVVSKCSISIKSVYLQIQALNRFITDICHLSTMKMLIFQFFNSNPSLAQKHSYIMFFTNDKMSLNKYKNYRCHSLKCNMISLSGVVKIFTIYEYSSYERINIPKNAYYFCNNCS